MRPYRVMGFSKLTGSFLVCLSQDDAPTPGKIADAICEEKYFRDSIQQIWLEVWEPTTGRWRILNDLQIGHVRITWAARAGRSLSQQ